MGGSVFENMNTIMSTRNIQTDQNQRELETSQKKTTNGVVKRQYGTANIAGYTSI